MASMLKTIIAFVVVLATFNQLHLTQTIQHADVIVSGGCIPGAANAEAADHVCLYRDVTVQGSVLKQGKEITTSNGIEIFVPEGSQMEIRAVSYQGKNASFTWQTWALIALAFGAIAWSMTPEITRLRRYFSSSPSDTREVP